MKFIQKYFCLSLVALFVAAIPLQANEQRSPKFVRYCSLFDSTYEGKNVSSRALMSYSTVSRVDGGDTFLYSPDCNEADNFAIPEGNSEVWGKLQNFFNKLQPEKNLILEVKFEGKPNVETSRLFGSLEGWARAQIELSKILSIRDVTSSPDAVLADHNTAKPHIERIEGMRIDLQDFLQSLYAPSSSSSSDVQNSLPNEFSFVDLRGKRFNKNQYLMLNTAFGEATSGLKESRTSSRLKSKTNSTLIWRGTLSLSYAAGPAKTYYCDVTFVLRNGKWALWRAAMVR